MAPRRKFNVAQTLPIWNTTHTSIVNVVFLSTLMRYGATTVHTYFERLRFVIAFCVVICACLGGYHYGFGGLILGGLMGLVAPLAVLWLGILLTGIVIFMGIYFGAWTALFYLAKWFLTGQLG